ncbi:DNA/RNA non-specific endonuclease [Arcticibacter sp.]|uniref:DNA/RNA non-specific endonuclease n=1 Tax=Arcticibacter sp. TaxID=1872630 RepID=UPI00388D90C0
MKKIVLFIASFCLEIVCYAQIGDLSKIGLLTHGGLPVKESLAPDDQVKVLINAAYISCYDEQLKNPLWVAYRLGNMKGEFKYVNWERPFRFLTDYRTESRVDHDAFNRSGYDRGHMAPNATILSQYGQLGQLETYLMTNICPQSPALNQGLWASLEKLERESLSQDDTPNKEVHDLFVITGPVFDKNPRRLASGVAVPTGFYRILAFRKGYTGTLKAVAFLFPQNPQSKKLQDYLTTIDHLESLTSLNFFPELSRAVQHNLESKKRDLLLNEVD